MRQISFSIGEKVSVIEDNKITNGVITKIFPEVDPPIVVVGFDDGTIAKVEIDRVAKIEEANTATEDDEIEENSSEEREPESDKEITITLNQFINVVGHTITEEMRRRPTELYIDLLLSMFSARLITKLFDEENGD